MAARIRSIKPEAPQHHRVGRLSIWARWLWLTMITQADDEGRLVADPGRLRLLAFGYDLDVTDVKVAELLAEIAAAGLIQTYVVSEERYASFPGWRGHQRIDRPSPSKLRIGGDRIGGDRTPHDHHPERRAHRPCRASACALTSKGPRSSDCRSGLR